MSSIPKSKYNHLHIKQIAEKKTIIQVSISSVFQQEKVRKRWGRGGVWEGSKQRGYFEGTESEEDGEEG